MLKGQTLLLLGTRPSIYLSPYMSMLGPSGLSPLLASKGPFMGLIFPFPSGSIDQIAHLGVFKVDITTDGNQYWRLRCKNCGHYLIGLFSISQWWVFHDFEGIYIPTGPNPPQCQWRSACFLVVSI